MTMALFWVQERSAAWQGLRGAREKSCCPSELAIELTRRPPPADIVRLSEPCAERTCAADPELGGQQDGGAAAKNADFRLQRGHRGCPSCPKRRTVSAGERVGVRGCRAYEPEVRGPKGGGMARDFPHLRRLRRALFQLAGAKWFAMTAQNTHPLVFCAVESVICAAIGSLCADCSKCRD